MSESPTVATCVSCGWVSTVPQGMRVPLDGEASEGRCWQCGGRTFRAAKEYDAPLGATLNDLLADE